MAVGAGVLACRPWACLTPGFWLSFGAVGLLRYTGVGRIGPTAAWQAAVRAQAAITLGLVPLMLVLFQQVSIVSPLANAVAIPVVTFIVVPLTLASIALPWDGLLVIAHQIFAWLALLLEVLSSLPAAVWQQHAPPLWTALAGAIGVLWLLAPRGVPARMLGLAWLAPLFVVVPPPPAPGAFRVTVLDVGQGLAVLVQTHAHALLYDTAALQRYRRCGQSHHRADAASNRHTRTRCAGGQSSGQRPQRRRAVAVADGADRLARLLAARAECHRRRAACSRRIGMALSCRSTLDLGRRGIRHALSIRLDLSRATDQDQ
jgi:hypothetical protein